MSIKGFNINGSVQRYDYDALDNKPSIDSGLSEQAKRALLACFEQVAWIGADGQTYYDALEAALYPQGYVSVTNTLVGCKTTNEATSAAVGKPYNATIIADNGYSLTGATVYITMGGTSVTGYYSNGTISIPNVTGDIVIQVTATSAISSITAVFTQGNATIYDTDSLDTLRQYLTVTATYSDSTTATVTDYTLSGTLTSGTSTITVNYGGKNTTFNVNVTSWDFAWDYSNGLLENQEYWIVSASSTGSSTMLSDGEKIVGGSNSYRQLYPKDAPYVYMDNGYGVMELVVYGSWASVANTAPLLVNTGNSAGSMRLCLMVNQGKWKLRNASNYSNATQLADAVSDTVYKVRIVLRGSVGDVYINNVLVGENIDTSTMTAGGANSITNNTDASFTVLQAVRIKSGSV